MYHKTSVLSHYCKWQSPPSDWAASVAQSDAHPTGVHEVMSSNFQPCRVWQHSFIEIDHEIFSVVVLSHLLIQEEQLSVSGKNNVHKYRLTEFSETPNLAYFYAYFCFCTRKIPSEDSHLSSIATGRPNWTSKTYRGLPKFFLSVEIDTQDVQKLSKRPSTFNKLYDVCPAYLLEIRYLCWLSFKDIPLSACGSFIDIGVKRRGTLLMAAWSLCVFVTRAELINWCLYN